MIVLAGDIGGTNTRLLCADLQGSERNTIAEKIYHSADYAELSEVINAFLSEHRIIDNIHAACFAVAGPVISGRAAVTNLPWVIREQELVKTLEIPKVKLINDFIAAVYGIDELQDNDILILQKGNNKSKQTNAVVIGAGTGFGVAHRVWLGRRYQTFSSEAGHVGFSPENEQQCALLACLQKKHSHVSLEMLLSGNGLITIYHYLHKVTGLPELPEIKNAKQKNVQAKIITDNALSNSDNLCEKTLECFIDIYGAAAGNSALNYYPIDEVYIAGGIGLKIKEKLLTGHFVNAFVNKGAMSSNMKAIGIKLILQDMVGLYGALAQVRTIL